MAETDKQLALLQALANQNSIAINSALTAFNPSAVFKIDRLDGQAENADKILEVIAGAISANEQNPANVSFTQKALEYLHEFSKNERIKKSFNKILSKSEPDSPEAKLIQRVLDFTPEVKQSKRSDSPLPTPINSSILKARLAQQRHAVNPEESDSDSGWSDDEEEDEEIGNSNGNTSSPIAASNLKPEDASPVEVSKPISSRVRNNPNTNMASPGRINKSKIANLGDLLFNPASKDLQNKSPETPSNNVNKNLNAQISAVNKESVQASNNVPPAPPMGGQPNGIPTVSLLSQSNAIPETPPLSLDNPEPKKPVTSISSRINTRSNVLSNINDPLVDPRAEKEEEIKRSELQFLAALDKQALKQVEEKQVLVNNAAANNAPEKGVPDHLKEALLKSENNNESNNRYVSKKERDYQIFLKNKLQSNNKPVSSQGIPEPLNPNSASVSSPIPEVTSVNEKPSFSTSESIHIGTDPSPDSSRVYVYDSRRNSFSNASNSFLDAQDFLLEEDEQTVLDQMPEHASVDLNNLESDPAKRAAEMAKKEAAENEDNLIVRSFNKAWSWIKRVLPGRKNNELNQNKSGDNLEYDQAISAETYEKLNKVQSAVASQTKQNEPSSPESIFKQVSQVQPAILPGVEETFSLKATTSVTNSLVVNPQTPVPQNADTSFKKFGNLVINEIKAIHGDFPKSQLTDKELNIMPPPFPLTVKENAPNQFEAGFPVDKEQARAAAFVTLKALEAQGCKTLHFEGDIKTLPLMAEVAKKLDIKLELSPSNQELLKKCGHTDINAYLENPSELEMQEKKNKPSKP